MLCIYDNVMKWHDMKWPFASWPWWTSSQRPHPNVCWILIPFLPFYLYLPLSYRWCWFALWAPSWLWSMNKLFWYIVLLFAELMLLFIQSSVVNCYMVIADCRHYWAVCVYVKLLHNVFALQDVKLFYMLPLQRHRLLSSVHIYIYIQWGKKVFSQPPIVQVLPLKKMREACNFHHRYTSTMRDKIRKKNPENHICRIFKEFIS